MSLKRILIPAGLVAVLLVTATAHPRAVHQPVTYWNSIAAASINVGRPGPPGMLDYALVHLAIHDAVQAIERRYEPYLFSDPTADGTTQAAVAGAAYGVLAALYPAQRPGPAGLDATFANYVSGNGLGADPGLNVGADAAAALLGQYRPLISMPANNGSTEIGEWRPTPPANSPHQFDFLSLTEPYALGRASQFRPQGPPPLTSITYAREYDEVKTMGSLTGAARTAAQTDMAHFWSENFLTQWNRGLRGIADGLLDTGDAARLFALATMAAADTFMSVWDSKVHFNLWRPITAIREGDNDPNDATAGDPAWTPLVTTPPYADYSSGANGLTGAMTGILALFFGTDDFEFEMTSVAPLAVQKTRQYSRFSEVADEVVEARILQGIHFRSADEEARAQGTHVAHWVFQKFLKPVPGRR